MIQSKLKKAMASVLAAATVATSMAAVVSVPTEALYFDKNSKFTYDLTVEGESDGLVKVTFYSTYNPGFNTLSIALNYDQDQLTHVRTMTDFDYYEDALVYTTNTADKGLLVTASATHCESDSSDQINYTDPVYFSYYFKEKNPRGTHSYDFSACVIGYRSETENIEFSKQLTEYPDETIKTVVSKGTYTRQIGNVRPSSKLIDMDDVTALLMILSKMKVCTSTNYPQYTVFLNNLLTADAPYTAGTSVNTTWREVLKDTLYADGVPFAEIADCDQNGLIEQTDVDLLLEYYAQSAAAQNPDSLISNELSKVVYAEITM